MSKPFKFRYVNEIAGSFVLATVILVILLIFFAGRAQGWFEAEYDIETEFPAEGAFGLIEGAEVQILQTVAGYVSEIEPTEDGIIRGVMTIRGKFMQYVRTDSVAKVKKKLAVGGDTFVQITRGAGDPLPEDALFIPSEQDNDLLQQLEGNIEEIKAAILPTVTQLRLGLREFTILAVDLRDEEGSLMQMLNGLRNLVQSAEEGGGVVGKLFADEETALEIDRLITEVRKSAEKLNNILFHVEKASASLPGSVSTVEKELEKLPEIIANGHSAVQEAERLITGIQKHWLVRKYIEEPEEPTALEPDYLDTLYKLNGRSPNPDASTLDE